MATLNAPDALTPADAPGEVAPVAEAGGGYSLAPVALLVVLLAAACQLTIGGRVSSTGEQLGFGVPWTTLILAGAALLAWAVPPAGRRWPGLPWLHLLLIASFASGLLGLPPEAWQGGLKEWVQIIEVFGLAWLLGRWQEPRHFAGLVRWLGLPALGFLALLVSQRVGGPSLGLSETRLAGLLVMAFPFLLVASRTWRWPVARVTAWLSALIVGLCVGNGGLLLVWVVVTLFTTWRCSGAWARRWLGPLVLALALSLVPRPSGSPWQTLNPHWDAQHPRRLFLEYQASLTAPLVFPLGAGLGQYKSAINHLRQVQPQQPHPEDTKIPRDSNSQYLLTLVEAGLLASGMLLLMLLLAWWRTGRLARAYRTDDATIHEAWYGLQGALLAVLLAGLFTTILGRGIGLWTGALLGLSYAQVAPLLPGSWQGHYLNRLTLPAFLAVAAILMLGVGMPLLAQAGDPRGPWNRRLATELWGAAAEAEPAPPPAVKTSAHTASGLAIVTMTAETPVVPRVRQEAETTLTLSAPLRAVAANDASNHQVLLIPNESGKAVGEASYTLDLPKAGIWRLRARVWWEDGCSNSVAFVLGDQPPDLLSSELFLTWHELSARLAHPLPAGPVKVILRNVEDGIRVDWFELELQE